MLVINSYSPLYWFDTTNLRMISSYNVLQRNLTKRLRKVAQGAMRKVSKMIHVGKDSDDVDCAVVDVVISRDGTKCVALVASEKQCVTVYDIENIKDMKITWTREISGAMSSDIHENGK